MSIDWNNAAIEAGLRAAVAHDGGRIEDMSSKEIEDGRQLIRAALAAVQAQGIRQRDLHALYGYEAGRADALEEAVRLLDRENQPMLADSIRALKEKKG